METRNDKKPHAVFVPLPFQGHIKPMLKLSKLIHHRGFHITFVNTGFNHNRLIKSKGIASLSGDTDAAQDSIALLKSITTNFFAPFLNLVECLNSDKELESPREVTCIVSDGFMMTLTVAAAEQLRIPIALFYTISASAFITFGHCLKIIVDMS